MSTTAAATSTAAAATMATATAATMPHSTDIGLLIAHHRPTSTTIANSSRICSNSNNNGICKQAIAAGSATATQNKTAGFATEQTKQQDDNSSN